MDKNSSKFIQFGNQETLVKERLETLILSGLIQFHLINSIVGFFVLSMHIIPISQSLSLNTQSMFSFSQNKVKILSDIE
jgi:hypothetical protein